MRPHHRGPAAVAALLTLTACGQSATDPTSAAGDGDALVFAAVPSEESSSLQQGYEPIIAMLEAETGRTVEFQNATDYAAVIEGMRAGKIDIAQFGPFSYVLAKNQGAKITPIGAQVDGPDEEPGYQSYGHHPGRLPDHRPGGVPRQAGLLRRPELHVRLPLPDGRAPRGRDQPGDRRHPGVRGRARRLGPRGGQRPVRRRVRLRHDG